MDSSEAAAQLIDPLYEQTPAEESGLNSHFRSTFAPISSSERINLPSLPQKKLPDRTSTNPFRKSSGSSRDSKNPFVSARPTSSSGLPTPPASASPHKSAFPPLSYRQEAFGGHGESSRGTGPGRRRASSLTERYPGDRSHQPLDIIRRDSKRAHRSPHLRKKHQPGPDTIDRLDTINGPYHHEGPYDAALLARNTSHQNSPVAALQDTNDEAIRATPRENIINSVKKHRPLDGVAVIPPGQTDRFGREYDYQEGDNMMIVDGGNYKRWPGVDYHPDDIKGKGEPAFSLDRALKQHNQHGEQGGIEMRTRNRRSLDQHGAAEMVGGREALAGPNEGPKRSNSLGGLKKKIGSLRRKPVQDQE